MLLSFLWENYENVECRLLDPDRKHLQRSFPKYIL